MRITARYPWATKEIWEWIERILSTSGSRFTVTSLYRPRWYNTIVGGLFNSYHLKGRAADLAPDNGNVGALAERARGTSPFRGQVIIEPQKGIVHIEIED